MLPPPKSLTWVCLQVEANPTSPPLRCRASLVAEEDLAFFLSDLSGELEPIDRGMLEEPSGLLEESNFLEEKNLRLNTIVKLRSLWGPRFRQRVEAAPASKPRAAWIDIEEENQRDFKL